ncbi:MAG: hypothetical protein RRZ24_00945 [Clostridia bacterium]
MYRLSHFTTRMDNIRKLSIIVILKLNGLRTRNGGHQRPHLVVGVGGHDAIEGLSSSVTSPVLLY